MNRVAVCVALLLAATTTGRANSVVFATGAQMLGGYAENASATFDINNSTHTITVHLLNLQFDPLDVHQAIGSVRFTINGAGAPVPSMETASGTVLDINSGGVIKNVAAMTTNVWQTAALLQGSGEQIALCAVCASGGTTGLIVGGPAASGKYDAADATLKGPTGTPWIIGSGASYASGALAGVDALPAWVINLGATNLSNVVITNVIFGFGEDANYGWNSITVAQETPEPDSAILFGTGLALMALAAAARRLRRP